MDDEFLITADKKNIVIWITIFLGLIILMISIVLTISFLNKLPPIPSIIINSNQTHQVNNNEILAYKDLCSTIQTNNNSVFEMLITKTLLPIFNVLITAIIAFIFVKKTNDTIKRYIELKNK